jgi:hypothetical protein
MYSRTFSATICVLWLTSMTWLVSQKVLPSLRVGEPPNYQTILEARNHDPIVGWRLAFNDRNLGWALSETKRQENGIVEVRSRVHFENLPLSDFTHGWLRAICPAADRSIEKLQLDTKNSMIFDPLGKLVRFDCSIQTDSFSNAVQVHGVIEGSQLKINIESNYYSDEKTINMPQNSIMADALSPQTQLPNLCEGQTWTVPSFSPFRSAGPMEILIAKVEGREPITWNDEVMEAWRVVYRNDPGVGLSNSEIARGKLWVATDGRVLKQQALVIDSTMTFTRMTDEDARILAWENKDE